MRTLNKKIYIVGSIVVLLLYLLIGKHQYIPTLSCYKFGHIKNLVLGVITFIYDFPTSRLTLYIRKQIVLVIST